MNKNVWISPVVLWSLTIFVIFFDYYSYLHLGAFGCFDDCSSYMAGYFLLQGKRLYSQIFFNHQPLTAYMSFLLQHFLHPNTIYALVLNHRIFVMLFGLVMDLILLLRFRFRIIGCIIFFESTKFYFFGDRYLAESILVYPLLYLFGLFWFSFTKQKLYRSDYLLAGIFAWFCLFLREPYILVIALLYGFFLLQKRNRWAVYSLFIFFSLSVLTLATLPLPDYFFNVVTVNSQAGLVQNDVSLGNVVMAFLYPVSFFFGGVWNIVRVVIIGIDCIFLYLSFRFLLLKCQKVPILASFFLLGFANLRLVSPGTLYYQAFHILVWYGLFLCATFFLLAEVYRLQKYKETKVLVFFSIVLFLVLFLSPRYYIHESVNRNVEFTTNYGNYAAYADILTLLKTPSDRLFLDGRDDLIYWASGMYSNYQYSWYTSVMPDFPIYQNARRQMFKKSPPSFYYSNCVKSIPYRDSLPNDKKNMYLEFYFTSKPTCLFVSKKKAHSITAPEKDILKHMQYSLQE